MPRNHTMDENSLAIEPQRPRDPEELLEDEEREEIANLAYQYWLDGGCRDGTAEEDWLRAERDLRGQYANGRLKRTAAA